MPRWRFILLYPLTMYLFSAIGGGILFAFGTGEVDRALETIMFLIIISALFGTPAFILTLIFNAIIYYSGWASRNVRHAYQISFIVAFFACSVELFLFLNGSPLARLENGLINILPIFGYLGGTAIGAAFAGGRFRTKNKVQWTDTLDKD